MVYFPRGDNRRFRVITLYVVPLCIFTFLSFGPLFESEKLYRQDAERPLSSQVEPRLQIQELEARVRDLERAESVRRAWDPVARYTLILYWIIFILYISAPWKSKDGMSSSESKISRVDTGGSSGS